MSTRKRIGGGAIARSCEAHMRRGRYLLLIGALASTVVTASGPVPPELGSFAPLDQHDLVDHFTGGFRYSLPLINVPGPNGGYPIVLSYASGVTPDQDASWAGHGWTLSPGAVVRQMRGIADDFSGGDDAVETTHAIEPNVSFGLGIGGNYEIFGVDPSVGTGLSTNLTGYFDNYRGFGITHSVGLSGQLKSSGTASAVGLSLSEDSLEGARVAATSSLALGDNMRFGADAAFDASRGLSALSFNAGAQYQSASFLVSSGNVLTYLGYAKPAALPAGPREMWGSNIKMTFKMGGEVYGNYLSGTMFGYYNVEQLKQRNVTSRAYGFLHLHKATPSDTLDFNREKDGPIYEQSPNLAMPVLTHDLFVVSGRDLVGTFRAYRNDVPVVFDPKQESELTGGAIGVDVGFGNVVKVGVSGALNHTSSVIQRWEASGAKGFLDGLTNAFADDPTGYRERTYFKFVGEPSFAPAATVSGSPLPVVPGLKRNFDLTEIPPYFFTPDISSVTLTASDQRVPRATLVQAFTNGELRTMANTLREFKRDFAPLAHEQYRRDNHIGAFRITTNSGMRYAYGIAAYNLRYEEHKFSVDRAKCAQTPPCNVIKPQGTGSTAGPIYTYNPTGSEKMLEIKSISPYSSSYLLTAILGPDYVDADDIPGPSDGDYGYWVKFNYVRAEDFPWRMPFLGASFVRGPDNGRFVAGTERLADKGYVTFGTRESWYLASIETATHQAFMCVARGDRRDAIGAASRDQNETPTTGFVRPWKLTSVKLFSKAALAGRVPSPQTNCPSGVPLIEAHLEYDTSLTKNAPNAPGGKLTLRKVHFTHLDSKRGRLSPYRFDYESTLDAAPGSAPNYNPPYADGGRDRWNVYRDPAVRCVNVQASSAPPPNPPLVDEDVATCQDDRVDDWSSAWSLRKIVEPSGRILRIDYEAGDYAYVQDRPATRLFPVTSVNAATPVGGSEICPVWSEGAAGAACATAFDQVLHPRVYFRLESPLPANDARCNLSGGCDAWVEQHYLEQHRQLYFRLRVALKTAMERKWQTISGYASAVRAGRATDDVGWVELAPVHSNYPRSLDYHPLAHAAWQYLRLEQPELIRSGGLNGEPGTDPLADAARVLTLVDAIPDIIEMFSGVYPGWARKGWGQSVDLSHSWIRLRDPDGIKKGGSARVSRIRVSDSWSASTSTQEPDLETGYIYEYRLKDGRSSGVATYEPMVGGEENALRYAKPFTDQVLLSSNYNLFADLPIGEAHYPAPAVGYSRVVRRSLAAQTDIDANSATRDCRNPARNARPRPTSAGPTVYEFYTARDFPVRSMEAPIDKRRPPVPQLVLIPLLGEITINSVTAAQGYATVLNDMHGKPRRSASYEYTNCMRADGLDYVMREEPVKETVFRYRSSGGFGGGAADLDNADIPTLIDDPLGKSESLAEQTDFVVDVRHNRTESFDGGINLNVDTFLVAIYPFPVPVPIPNFGYSLNETKTIVTSRIVHRAGVLEAVSVRNGSARVTTRNDRYDPLTGSALLSTSDNAFGNPIYSYTMPARWSRARMGAGYEEVGRILDLTGGVLDASRTRLTLPQPPQVPVCSERPPQQSPRCLPLGTELAAPSATGGARLTLIGEAPGALVFAIDGDAPVAPTRAVAVRSGNRNMLTAMTDNIRALANPLEDRTSKTCTMQDKPSVTQFKIERVLDAAHTTYADRWPEIGAEVPPGLARDDDYSRGIRGIFRAFHDYTYFAERAQSPQVNLAIDGTFGFVLFGKGETPATCEPGWLRRLSHVRYSASGFPTEDVNALGIPSGAVHGARGSLLVGVASNATRREIGYDGFETGPAPVPGTRLEIGEGTAMYTGDSVCKQCALAPTAAWITTELAHTGRRSLKVAHDPTFEPARLDFTPGKRYVVSAWVSLGRVGSPETDVATYARAQGGSAPVVGLRLLTPGVARGQMETLTTFQPDGPIIDGWQRIDGVFEAPAGGERVWLQFLTGARDQIDPRPAYFDDLRIYPEDASFETFVYDPDTLRMTAKLDENNFATFYRYTPDGKVDLVRRETVRGVFTERESRVHTREAP